MMEKEVQYLSAYIDGTLSAAKKEEFEKLLRSRADLQEQMLLRRSQVSKLTGLIPKVSLSKDVRENIEQEIKNTLSQVIEQKPVGIWERIRSKLSSH